MSHTVICSCPENMKSLNCLMEGPETTKGLDKATELAIVNHWERLYPGIGLICPKCIRRMRLDGIEYRTVVSDGTVLPGDLMYYPYIIQGFLSKRDAEKIAAVILENCASEKDPSCWMIDRSIETGMFKIHKWDKEWFFSDAEGVVFHIVNFYANLKPKWVYIAYLEHGDEDRTTAVAVCAHIDQESTGRFLLEQVDLERTIMKAKFGNTVHLLALEDLKEQSK